MKRAGFLDSLGPLRLAALANPIWVRGRVQSYTNIQPFLTRFKGWAYSDRSNGELCSFLGLWVTILTSYARLNF